MNWLRDHSSWIEPISQIREANTYCQFFKNVYEDFVLSFFLRVKFLNRLLDGCTRYSARLEKLGLPTLLLFLAGNLCFFYQNWFINDVLPYVLSCDKLRVSIIYDFIDDFVNEHEILPDWLFVQDSAVVSEHLHHAINHVVNNRRWNVVFSRGHKVNAELFCKKIVHSIDMLQISLSAKGALRK